MNERLTELYRASRPKEALASQDEFKSANTLLGSEVEKFAKLILRECKLFCGHDSEGVSAMFKHFGVEE